MRPVACSIVVALAMLGVAADAFAQRETRLLRRPTVNSSQVAFSYAGDLWIVSRSGGRARRLTSTPGVETDPRFSPDGSQVAFSATVGGNADVYVMPAAGGPATRLTYHPGLDYVRGWTPDGKHVVFASSRAAVPMPRVSSYTRLWTVRPTGGPQQMLPPPRAYTGAFSPDGTRMAYEEFAVEFETLEAQNQSAQWRRYRGGRTHPIRVMNLRDYSEEKLPWQDSVDSDPMWIGQTIYFLSDRSSTVNLFAYHIDAGQLTQLTDHDDHDVMNASAGDDAIVYEQAGYIHLFDIRTGRARRLSIEARGEFPWAKTRNKKVGDFVRGVKLAPTGSEVAFEARGDIFVMPTGSTEGRNITRSSEAHDRNPALSEDGREIAWISDASGEYQLFVSGVSGSAQPRAIPLPTQGYFSGLTWSPDSRHLLLRDSHLSWWTLELASGRATRIDSDMHDEPERPLEAVWSPDSRWIAYSKNGANHLQTIYLYSLVQRRAYPVTDGTVDAISPAFDASGKYLYFLVSTNYALNAGSWIDMSAIERPVTRSVYLAVLSASGTSPFLDTMDKGAAASSAAIRIDAEGLQRRIVALDVPAKDYANLRAGAPGILFYAEHINAGMARQFAPRSLRVHRYQLATRSATTFLEGVGRYALSADKGHVLYQASGGGEWGVVASEQPAIKLGDGALRFDELEMQVDLRAEWANIFREAWRAQRDYFYQPTMHGANWPAIYEKYRPLVAHVNHRVDLGYLLAMVGGELSVSHSSLSDLGDVPADEPRSVGMLAANYSVEHGLYRIRRIYRGDPWDATLQAPLAVPGIDVAEGDYLLEVDGQPLAPPDNLYRLFEGTAGKPTQLRVSRTPSHSGSRLVSVVPLANDEPLRTYEDWIEKNRRRVDELSGGRLGYLWLPNTGPHGHEAFNRDYYAQQHKEGMIVDERYNQGGYIADSIVNAMAVPQMGYAAMREGAAYTTPVAALYGPKVMLINESSGSGGDLLPYYFKLQKMGPLVGTRSWGGVVGVVGAVLETIDGGGINTPNAALYDLAGRLSVENEGIVPDIEVENSPAAVIAGRDPQLERAVQEALKLLEQNPRRPVPQLAPVDRVARQAGRTSQ